MTMQHITATVTTHENVNYANLGSGDLAESMAHLLVALHAGHQIKVNGEHFYYNGACDPGYPTTQEAYQHMIDSALRSTEAYWEDAEGYAD